MKMGTWAGEALKKLGQYKYVLLVALVGAVLLLLPTGEEREKTVSAAPVQGEGDLFRTGELEGRLEAALSGIEGAGEVRVVLTLRESPRVILDGEGSEVQKVGPVYQGALVVAQGGDDPQVKLKLARAVSALTGLGTDKIHVCKGK